MPRTLQTVRQFCEANPAWSENSMRWHIFNAAQNGLNEAGVIVRQGRRVLIDPERWDAWLDHSQNV